MLRGRATAAAQAAASLKASHLPGLLGVVQVNGPQPTICSSKGVSKGLSKGVSKGLSKGLSKGVSKRCSWAAAPCPALCAGAPHPNPNSNPKRVDHGHAQDHRSKLAANVEGLQLRALEMAHKVLPTVVSSADALARNVIEK